MGVFARDPQSPGAHHPVRLAASQRLGRAVALAARLRRAGEKADG